MKTTFKKKTRLKKRGKSLKYSAGHVTVKAGLGCCLKRNEQGFLYYMCSLYLSPSTSITTTQSNTILVMSLYVLLGLFSRMEHICIKVGLITL